MSPSFHSPVALSRYRGVDAMRNRATGHPGWGEPQFGVVNQVAGDGEGGLVLMGGPSVPGPPALAGAWFAFAVWRVAALAATALSAAACRRRLSVKGGAESPPSEAAKGAKSFPEEPLDTEWRHAKLRRMQGQPGRRPVL